MDCSGAIENGPRRILTGINKHIFRTYANNLMVKITEMIAVLVHIYDYLFMHM